MYQNSRGASSAARKERVFFPPWTKRNIAIDFSVSRSVSQLLWALDRSQNRHVVSGASIPAPRHDTMAARIAQRVLHELPRPMRRSEGGRWLDPDKPTESRRKIQKRQPCKAGAEMLDDPLVVVLLQEIDKYNALLSTITTTLSQLIKDSSTRMTSTTTTTSPNHAKHAATHAATCAGDPAATNAAVAPAQASTLTNQFASTATSSALAACLIHASVPDAWASVAYPSLKSLGPWLADLSRRVSSTRAWLTRGRPPFFTLPRFFAPGNLLVALVKRHATAANVDADSLTLSSHIVAPGGQGKHTSSSGAADHQDPHGVQIEGIHIWGAVLDRQQLRTASNGQSEYSLARPTPMQAATTLLPTIHVQPVPKNSPASNAARGTDEAASVARKLYACPLYATAHRNARHNTPAGVASACIWILDLPISESDSVTSCVLRGVAALLDPYEPERISSR
eukprot:6177372-Pleurochrysis_carterae.AAC.2